MWKAPPVWTELVNLASGCGSCSGGRAGKPPRGQTDWLFLFWLMPKPRGEPDWGSPIGQAGVTCRPVAWRRLGRCLPPSLYPLGVGVGAKLCVSSPGRRCRVHC